MTNPRAASIGTIYSGFYPNIVHKARRVLRSDADAEDAAQEVMLSLLEAPHLLDGVERLGAWLATLVYRRCVDIIRGRVRLRDRETRAGIEELFERKDDIENLIVQDEVCVAVARAADELPPPLRTVFIENVLDGRTFRTMSRKSGIPMGTLMARKKKAVDQIRRKLRGQGLIE